MSSPTTLGALVALFDGDAALAGDFAASGGLWVGGVPETNTDLPVCVLADFQETPDWNFESATRTDHGSFKLMIYAVGLAAVESLAADVLAAFDPRSGIGGTGFIELDVLGKTSAWVVRQDYRIRAVEYRASDSSWVYEVAMPFQSEVTRAV